MSAADRFDKNVGYKSRDTAVGPLLGRHLLDLFEDRWSPVDMVDMRDRTIDQTEFDRCRKERVQEVKAEIESACKDNDGWS